jgi:hypothetical protein
VSWLIREDDVLAVIEEGAPGWPDSIEGAVVRRAPVLVHTLRTPTGMDLAWCLDGRTEEGAPCLKVRRIACLRPKRMALPHLMKGAVVAGAPGAFERWQLKVGDCLEIREA